MTKDPTQTTYTDNTGDQACEHGTALHQNCFKCDYKKEHEVKKITHTKAEHTWHIIGDKHD